MFFFDKTIFRLHLSPYASISCTLVYCKALFKFFERDVVSLVAVTEMFHCAGALRLDNRKVFLCPGRKVSLVVFIL